MDALNRAEPETTDRDLSEQVDRFLAVLETGRTPMQRILAQLDELQVRAVSENGLVEVTVDADGTVTRTDVAAEAVHSGPPELAAAFTEAARAAGEAARERRTALFALLAEDAGFTRPAAEAAPVIRDSAGPYRENPAGAPEFR